MGYHKINYKIKAQVEEEIEYFPLTGIYSIEEEISGAAPDRVRIQQNTQARQSIKTSIGGYNYNLIEGSSNKHWDGGVINGCELQSLKINSTSITPFINTGVYTLYDKSKQLYSSHSSCKLLNDLNNLFDTSLIKTESLSLNIFRRDEAYNNIPWINYKYSPEVLPEEDYYFNFISPNLSINRIYDANTWYEDLTDITDKLEKNGKGNGASRTIYSKYFPLDLDNVQLYSITNGSGEVTTWTKVDSFIDSNVSSEPLFIVNPERGILVTSGHSIDTDKIYKFERYSDSKSIFVYEDITGFPNQGMLLIGSTLYKYDGIKNNYIHHLSPVNLEDDYSDYDSASTFKFRLNGRNTSTEEIFYINYKVCVRADYESDDAFRIPDNINLKPRYLNKSNGILQINCNEKHVSELKLSSNKTELRLGIDFISLSVNAFNNNGDNVPDIPVTFKVLQDDIKLLFEGDSYSITNITNLYGRASTSVTAPYDDSFMRLYSKQTGSDSITIDDLNFNFEDVTVFAQLRYNGIERIEDPASYIAQRNQTEDYMPELVERLLYYKDGEVYKPLRAASYANNNLNFSRPILSVWDSVDNPDSLIYRYKIYYSRIASIQAYCIDPATGSKIFSKKLSITIKLPLHMQGVDISTGYINGFQIKDSDKAIATGLGGVNYITINPEMTSTLSLRVK